MSTSFLIRRTAAASAASAASAAPLRLARHVIPGQQQPQQRHFSLGAAFAAASTTTAESITFIHHCGLPWYVTIPLVAATVNFTCRLPVYWYVRVLQNRRTRILPLYQAWTSTHAQEAAGLVAGGPSSAVSQENVAAKRKRDSQTFKLIRRSRQRLYRQFSCQTWKSFTPLLSMGPFIMVTDALRRLVGTSTLAGDGSAAVTGHGLVEQSITEGGLAWFTDLSLQDPYMVLPLVCSVAMASSAWRGMDAKTLLERLTGKAGAPNGLQFLSGVMGRVAVLIPVIPLLLYSQPAAIFLYWITTFSLNHANSAIYDRFLPVPKPELKPSPPQVSKEKPHVSLPWLHSGEMQINAKTTST
ncbi:mitochondrial inner membrane protein COX18 [Geosmithia morbida]|uniref:Mitochondrial inner membrane protein COX18 n=1 Tax=Geosmithia morbida TaxID=1094350 RepID=A0A9P5D4B8_9HYPO|nr:mitochondrial inner membrane protein COX18 [Geosmithia morbida]KAF4125882.1 mitochondrial inner membrane protein COX18 [Geosmithia morbida]